MKILILGHGGHGKDTVAEILYDHFGFTFSSSSLVALPHIFPCLQSVLGYKTPIDAWNDRSNHRVLWKDLIELWNAPSYEVLTDEILSLHDIYVGMRSETEFNINRHKFDIILWVEAFPRLRVPDDSLLIQYEPSFYLVTNNATKEDLKADLLELFYKKIGAHQK